MAKLSILAGATSQSVNVFVRDSSSTTGAGLGAVAPAGGSLLSGTKLYYSFTGANAAAGTAVSLAVLAAVNSAWSSSGIVTIDGTNMLGWVRIDIPNAAIVGSKGRVVSFLLFGGTNMAPTPFEIELTGTDNQDGVRMGMTALPAAAPNAAGGLLITAAGSLDMDEMNVDIEAIQTSTAGLTFTGAGKVDASVRDWVGDTIPARNVTGVPIVDTKYVTGTLQTAADVGGIVTDTIADLDELIVGVTVSSIGAGVITSSSFAAGAINSASLNADTGLAPIRSGTAQAGAATTITLDAGASATDNFYQGLWVRLTGGTGSGQCHLVSSYVGATKVVTVRLAWAVNPDNTTTFALVNAASVMGAVLVDTATNLTNAPTSGDLTAAMKTSVQTAADAAVTANALILEIEADTDTLTAGVTIAAYASGQDPATLILAGVLEGSITIAQAMRLMLAADTAKTSGAGTGTFTIRDVGDTKNRVVATTDGSGNRTAIGTRDGT